MGIARACRTGGPVRERAVAACPAITADGVNHHVNRARGRTGRDRGCDGIAAGDINAGCVIGAELNRGGGGAVDEVGAGNGYGRAAAGGT